MKPHLKLCPDGSIHPAPPLCVYRVQFSRDMHKLRAAQEALEELRQAATEEPELAHEFGHLWGERPRPPDLGAQTILVRKQYHGMTERDVRRALQAEASSELAARAEQQACAVAQILAACPAGTAGMAQALILYDQAVLSAEQVVVCVRRELGLSEPVIAGGRELADDLARLYRGPHLDTASGSAAGG